MGLGGQRHAPAALPPGKTRYPLYRELSGAQGLSGRMQKLSSPPGLDPWTMAHLRDKKLCLGKLQTVSIVRKLSAQINDSILNS
jgi:hypothetical protein